MSTTVNFATVANSIAALSITGVDVLDIDQIPDAMGLDTAVLVPMPEDFITEVEIIPAELTQQNLDLSYTLHYRYYHCKIAGGLGGLFATYNGLVTAAANVLLAFANDATLSGAVNNTQATIANIGPVSDPAGNGFHGFDVTIRVLQFLEV